MLRLALHIGRVGEMLGDVCLRSDEALLRHGRIEPIEQVDHAVLAKALNGATRRGVEVSNKFNVLDWLALTATYTYTNAKDSKGNEEVRRPPHSASLDATAYFDERRLRVTVGVHYNSVRKDFFFQAFPLPTLLVDLPATTVVRASLAYDLTRELTAFIRAENLFNLHYEEVFSYRAPPFAIYAGLKLRLGQ